MGFSETDSSNCRKHPTHRQSPGVCSSCLREKLSKLSISPSSFNRNKPVPISNSSSASSSPPYSSASATATRKSSVETRRHRRNGSEAYVSVGMVLNNGLKKSRSVSCANLSSRSKLGSSSSSSSSNINKDVTNDKFKSFVKGGGGGGSEVEEGSSGNNNIHNTKKKNGFLKKLLMSKTKTTKAVFMQSKTMKERPLPIINN